MVRATRLIDADRFLVQIEDQYMEHDLTRSDYLDIEDRILQQPTIDAVEVVRCGECNNKYMKDFDMFCPYMVGILKPNMYCSRGEREGE